MNLEMATTDEMIAIATKIKPEDCCLVPEKREELTTEGGLEVASQIPRMTQVCAQLAEASIVVSLFIDAQKIRLMRQKNVVRQLLSFIQVIMLMQQVMSKNKNLSV